MAEYTVKIHNGSIKGKLLTNCLGEEIYGFMGIPYAEPPVGNLRFKAPLPAKSWDGIKDCTRYGNMSLQQHPTVGVTGSEDCLTINVFMKELSKSTPKPVLFWIHGGALKMSSGSGYGPENILTEDVVYVTFNYRLGIFGFLSIEDSTLGVPGNAGFKDMILALKWVQQNISVFNGDPNNVTIFGESAGGCAVHYLLLSPMSEGLFHKAIAMSGSSLNPLSLAKRYEGAHEVAKSLNLKNSNEKEILDHFRSLPADELLKAASSVPDNLGSVAKRRFFGLVVEKPSEQGPNFLSKETLEVLLSGNFQKVPLITGYTKDEGMFLETVAKLENKKPFITDFESIIPHTVNLKDPNEAKAIAERVKTFYFGKETPSEANVEKSFDVFTDAGFLYGVYRAVKLMYKHTASPIYVYRFSFDCLGYDYGVHKFTHPGTCHGADLLFLFDFFKTGLNKPGSTHAKIVTYFVKLWTNFARTGNPNPTENDPLFDVEWKPVDEENFNYIDINEKLSVGNRLPEEERMKFWDSIFNV